MKVYGGSRGEGGKRMIGERKEGGEGEKNKQGKRSARGGGERTIGRMEGEDDRGEDDRGEEESKTKCKKEKNHKLFPKSSTAELKNQPPATERERPKTKNSNPLTNHK